MNIFKNIFVQSFLIAVVFWGVFSLFGDKIAVAKSNYWEGWDRTPAYGLVRHYDKEFGVMCYMRTESTQYTNGAPYISCVKVEK